MRNKTMKHPISNYALTKDDIDSLAPETLQQLIQQLENGQVIYLPQMPFTLDENEAEFLTPNVISEKAKNISFNIQTGKLGGADLPHQQLERLGAFMRRFSEYAQELIHHLFPSYHSYLKIGRTSYRPVEVKGRPSSYRKDDTRLHVDAFPSMPVQGQRILRVFSNVNPFEKPRIWNLGESFEQVADRFLPQIPKPSNINATLLKTFKITKSLRTPYDHYMLHIHDAMKADENYQGNVNKVNMQFPPNTTWCVFTDKASHAALNGQYLLEQTFYLPIAAMDDESKTPLRILEKKLGRRLAS